jgi:hypothetical protein
MVGGSDADRVGAISRLVGDPAGRPVLFVALAWALLGLVQLVQLQGDPFFHEPTGDAGYFVALGHALASGAGLGEGPLFYSPAMGLLHAPLFWLFGDSMLPYALLALALGTGLAAGIALLARLQGGVPAAWLAGGLWLGYRMGFFFQAEPVFALHAAAGAVALCLILGAGAPASLSTPRCFAAGCLIGAVAIGRTNLIVLAPVVAAWLLIEAARGAPNRAGVAMRGRLPAVLAVLAGAFLLSLPGAAYNRSQGSESFFRVAGGFTFWVGNSAQSAGVFIYPPGFPQGVGHAYFADASRWTASQMAGRDLTPDEASTYYFRAALDDLAERGFAGSLALYGQKAFLLLCADEVPVHRHHGFADGYVPMRRWLPVSYALLVGLSLLGVGPLMAKPVGRLMVMMVPVMLLSVLPFFANDRLRFPVAPLLAVAAGVGVARLPALLRAPTAPSLLLVGLCLVAILGLHVTPRVPGRHRAHALEFERLGALEANRQHFREAAQAFDRCLEIAPENDSCRWMRAQVSVPLEDITGLCGVLAPRIGGEGVPPPIVELHREHCSP